MQKVANTMWIDTDHEYRLISLLIKLEVLKVSVIVDARPISTGLTDPLHPPRVIII